VWPNPPDQVLDDWYQRAADLLFDVAQRVLHYLQLPGHRVTSRLSAAAELHL
jgi:hypothetical protein